MTRKAKKYFSKNKLALSFREIDAKLLMGWECIESPKKQKDFLEELKSQTMAAMENKKFFKNRKKSKLIIQGKA
tara:strand:+ start:632 stop:853 length:222 start_codon:yes stop_codon:yes gene_type:complete